MCETLICRDCILFEHKNHDYVFVHDVIDELKTKFDNNFQLIQSILNHGFKQVETLNIEVNHVKQINQTRINELAKTIRQIIDDYEKTVIEQIEENTNGDKKQIAEYEKHLQNQQQNLNMRRALYKTLKLTHNHTRFLQLKQELLGYINKACVDLDRLKLPVATNWDIDDFNKLKENILQFEHVDEATQHQSGDPSKKIQSKHYLSCEVSNDNINVVIDALRNNKPLTKLTIDGSEIEDDAFQQLAHALKFNETLQTLNLNNYRRNGNYLEHLSEILQQTKTLTSLCLEKNNMEDDGMYYLANILPYNTTLIRLDLYNNNIGCKGIEHLADVLRQNKSLEILCLSDDELGDTEILILANALRCNKTLTAFTFCNDQIKTNGAKYLANALRHNKTLTTLVLGKNDIEAEETKQLADALKYNTTLNMLVLSSNNIGDDGAQFLSDALRHNNVLTTLGLSNNEIKAEGADHLGNALRENQKLTTLILSKNEIQDDGIRYIAEALKYNNTLTVLILSMNDIKENGVMYLCEALQMNYTLQRLGLCSENTIYDDVQYLTDMFDEDKKMFHMKYVFYLIFINWIVAIPQINLYFTNQVSESENYDEIGIRYNCIRLASNMDQEDSTRQISSYCMSESSLKFHIENDNTFPTFSFANLAKTNITSEDLYFWSTPIDIIEQYQIYLLSNDSSLAEKIFYNCTLPRFGSMCQYELYIYHENYSSLYEMISSYYKNYLYDPTNLTCYTHVQCHRGYSPACLDWTEICDGKVDCLDGEYDEEHCWELEFTECEPNEYRCNIGQCIPDEFVQDDTKNFDCIDRSDERVRKNIELETFLAAEPAFAHDDTICRFIFVTSSCIYSRESTLIESMFSIKDNNVSDECWSAYKCYFAINTAEHPNLITYKIINEECIPIIRKTCPDMLYVPNIPILFGHVYTAYKKNELLDPQVFLNLPYLCSNKSFYDDSLELVLATPLNNTMCFKLSRFTPWSIPLLFIPDVTSQFQKPKDNVFQIIKNHHAIINFPRHRCNESNFYQCSNSSKCISFHRLINGVTDCPYNDDENIYEDTNPELFTQVKHKYYKCHVTNKYIAQLEVSDGKCHCGLDEYNFCEDEDIIENFTRRTLSFQTTCDDFQELYSITIDRKNETDETECEEWECDNIYTHCDEIWNCLDGKDEMNCDYSLPPLINCSSDYQKCVILNTSELTCLPINKVNDGISDCLGGTDERALCQPLPYTNLYGQFACQRTYKPICLLPYNLCDGFASCLYKDDERFCRTNRSSLIFRSVCQMDDTRSLSYVEKFLCVAAKIKARNKIEYFTIDGFNQSFENKINENQQIDVIYTDVLDESSCHRGLDLRVWLNKSSNIFTSTCLCPPSYYGNQCQYQNQRLVLSIRFQVSAQSRQILFAILIMLIDNTNQRMIHSYEQFTYLSIRDCNVKFNVYLVYSNRPKDMNKNYSVHIDIYEKLSLKYRASFNYPVEFLFLPVHHLAFIINIPLEDDYSCSNKKCLHGKCLNYFNTKETFCQCDDQGWFGKYCDIPHNNCNCSSNSICIGRASDNQSICICREYYFGSKCYLRNRICDNSPCRNNGSCIPYDDFMLTKIQKYLCICPKGFSGDRCELINTQVDLIFDKNIHLSHSIFIHFIRIIPEKSPERSTTLQVISQATNSIRIYWSQPFHLMFIETLEKMYYLTVIQPVHNYSTKITQRINSSHHCPPINKLVNDTFAQLHVIRRMKYYHSLICQKYSPNLLCFHDDIHMCLCYDYQGKRLANCF
ncbi:unnamed protein product, partial [Adineta steineri]